MLGTITTVLGDEVDDQGDALQAVNLVISDRDMELGLEQADHLGHVEFASAQITLEACIARDEVLVNSQLLGNDLDDS